METFRDLIYEQLEQILGDKLPMAAYKYPEWWGNGNETIQLEEGYLK